MVRNSKKILAIMLICILCLTNISMAIEIEAQAQEISEPVVVSEEVDESNTSDSIPKQETSEPVVVSEEVDQSNTSDSIPKQEISEPVVVSEDVENIDEFINVRNIDEFKAALELNPERIQIQNTIDITEDIFISKDITLFRSNGFYGNLFCVKSGNKFTLDGVSVDATGDESQINTGSIIVVDKDAKLEINDSNFFGNTTNVYGGAIYNNGESIIENTKFQNNKTTKSGGAIYNAGSVVIKDSYFDSNYSINEEDGLNSEGGAIYNEYGELVISSTEFLNNVSSEYGGAIYSKTSFEMSKTKFEDNVSLDNSEDNVKSDAIYSEMGLNIVGEATEINQSIYLKEEFINDADLLEIKATVFSGKVINNKKIQIEDKLKTNLVENNSLDSNFEIYSNSSIEIKDGMLGSILNNGTIYLNYSGTLENQIGGEGNIIYDNSGELKLLTNTQNSIQIKDGTVVSGKENVSVKNIILNGGKYKIKNVSENDIDTPNKNILYIKAENIIGNGIVEIELNDNIRNYKYYYIGDYNNIENNIKFKFKNSFGLEQLIPVGYSEKVYKKENFEHYIMLKNYSLEGFVYEADGKTKAKNVNISIGNKNVYIDQNSFYKIEGFGANENQVKVTVDGVSIWEDVNFDIIKNKNIILPKRFFVSGKIIDESGGTAKDVLVKVGSKKVKTDENGNYKIENIISSDISVEPEKIGYIFLPTYKKLALKEDTKNVDFIIKPDPNLNNSLGNKWTDEGIYDSTYYNDVKINYDKINDFLIDTPQKLAAISKLSDMFNFKNKNIVLINDIDLGNYQWDPISKKIDFGGNFDGQNHIIKNLTIGSNKISDVGPNNTGLFSILSNDVTCKNISFENVFINSSAYNIGVLSGFVNSADIINISVLNGKIKGGINTIGGIIGKAETIGEISGCSVNVEIKTGTATTGGIIGAVNKLDTIQNSVFKGNIYSSGYTIGAIVGIIKDGNSIINTYSEGLFQGSAGGSKYEWGGIGGNCKLKEVTNVYSKMDIFGTLTSEIGIFGILKSDDNLKLDHIYQYGNLYGTCYAGGISGCISAKTINASNLYVFGHVKGGVVGGFFGYGTFEKIEISDSGVLGELLCGYSSDDNAGVFIGYIYSNVKKDINIYSKNVFYINETKYKEIGYSQYYSIPNKYIYINGSNQSQFIFENLIDYKNDIEKGTLTIAVKEKFIQMGINVILDNFEDNLEHSITILNGNNYRAILKDGYRYSIFNFPINKITTSEIQDNGIGFPDGYNKLPSSKNTCLKMPIIKGTIDYRNEKILLPNINYIKLNGKIINNVINNNLVWDIKDILGTKVIFDINNNLFRYTIPFRTEPPKDLKIIKILDGMYYQIENLVPGRLCEYSFDAGKTYTLIKSDSNGLIVVPGRNIIDLNGSLPNLRIRYTDTETSFKSVAYGDTKLGSSLPEIMPIEADMLEVKFYKNDMSGDFFVQYIKKGEKIKEPAVLKRTGYQFLGWYEDSRLTDNSKWNFEQSIKENKKLYAKWGAYKKLINPELENKEFIYDKKFKEIKLKENNLNLKENIDYKIIYLDKNGNAKKPIDSGVYTVKFELTERGNLKYYLDYPVESELKILPKLAIIKWSGNETRKFDGNNSNVKAEVLNIEQGDDCKVEVENGKQIGDQNNLKTYIAKVLKLSNLNYILSGDTITEYTIIPKDLKLYVVTFKDRQGNNIESKTVEEDKAVIPPKEPTELGYKFIGWYTESEFGEEFNSFNSIKRDIVIYARYKKITNNSNSEIEEEAEQEDIKKEDIKKEDTKKEIDNEYIDNFYNLDTNIENILISKPVYSKIILKEAQNKAKPESINKENVKEEQIYKSKILKVKLKAKTKLKSKLSTENKLYKYEKNEISKREDIKEKIIAQKKDCKIHISMILILITAFILDIYLIKKRYWERVTKNEKK